MNLAGCHGFCNCDKSAALQTSELSREVSAQSSYFFLWKNALPHTRACTARRSRAPAWASSAAFRGAVAGKVNSAKQSLSSHLQGDKCNNARGSGQCSTVGFGAHEKTAWCFRSGLVSYCFLSGLNWFPQRHGFDLKLIVPNTIHGHLGNRGN